MEAQTAVAPPLLHSVEEVMVMTNLGRSVIYEKLKTGEIESVKVGARRLIPHDAVLQFVSELRNVCAP
jgi:excisionase family DNA binding protein